MMVMVRIKLIEIKPYSKNGKRHSQKQIQQIANSIKEFGFNQPIVIDRDNVIIVGHGRYEAAKLLDLKEVPVLQVDLDEKRAKAYRLADNKLNESEWDMSLVIEELKELDTLGFDIDLTGFDRDLLIEPDEKDDFIPDNAPTRCKRGDIWLLGNHRLMCGDSTKREDVERLMDGKKAELLFTSPPYSDMRTYGGGKDLLVDNLSEFVSVFGPYVNYQVINLGIQRKNGEIFEYWNEYIRKAREVDYKFLSWNVWNRETARSIGQQRAFFPIAHEWIFIFGKESKDINKTKEKSAFTKQDKRLVKTRRQKDGSTKYSSVGNLIGSMTKMTSVFTSQPELSNAVRKTHPATFPVLFPQEFIKAMTKINDIVVDPFLGSGSTLIAAEKTNRICYGMEIDEKYCDVIIKRWEDYTSQKAINVV